MKKMLFALILALILLLPALAEDNCPERISLEYEGRACYLTYNGRGLFTLFDENGSVVKKQILGSLKYDEATDTYLIHVGEHYGYLDADGKWLFPLEFDSVYAFQENGIALVEKEGLWGYILADGTYLLEPQFENDNSWAAEEKMQFYNGVARVYKDSLYGFIREDGTYLFEPQFRSADPFWYCEITLVRNEVGLYGYITAEGQYLFVPQFELAEPFMDTESLPRITKNDLDNYINSDGEYLFELQFEWVSPYFDLDDEYAGVKKDGLYGLIKQDGTYLIEPRFEEEIYFCDGLAAEPVDGLYGYIDLSGEFVIPPSFARAQAFSERLAAVESTEGKWGYIDTTGNYIVEPRYDRVYDFENGFGEVNMLNGKKAEWWGKEFDDYYIGLVDYNGRVVLEPIYDEIQFAEDGIITAEKDGEKRAYIYENGQLKEIDIVDTELYLSDYYPFEGKKVATLDEEADIVWDNGSPLPKLDGATALLPTYAAFAQATYPDDTCYQSNNSALFTCTKTNKAYDRLIGSDTDIIFCAGPSDAQIADAAAAGLEFELTQMGYESFVFIVNMENPLDNITVQQIKDIYSGKLTQWDELGISDMGEIIAYQRPKNSGSQTALERLMGDTPLMEAPSMWVSDGMEDILETIEYRNYPNAIGYTFRFFCADMVGSKVKLLAIDGVEPNVENINNGTYPIITPLYAVTRKGETNPNVQIFLDWITGEQGQELVEKSGYVGIVERQ